MSSSRAARAAPWRCMLALACMALARAEHALRSGCDVAACETTAGADGSHIACDPHALLAQHAGTREHIAATATLRHPVQPYLLDPSPWPPGYAPLPNATAVAVDWQPALDYCYRADRLPGWDTDLGAMLVRTPCSRAASVPARAFVLRVRNAFVNLRGDYYVNSLQVFSCSAHVLFGGCNENIPLGTGAAAADALHGVEDAVVVPRLAVIATRWGSSYYHWILEELPRVMHLRAALAADPALRVLVHDHRSNRALLRALGVDDARIVPAVDARMYFAHELLVPPVAHCGRPALAAIAAMRSMLRHTLNVTAPGRTGHVLVIQRAGGRATANHAELLAALEAAFPDTTFVTYGPDYVDMHETARMFGGARGVIGVHGAGMSNLVFAAPNTFLIELHPRGSNQRARPNVCHQGTAAALGLRHTMLWLPGGEFNGAVAAPVAAVVRAVCALDGGPATTCATSILVDMANDDNKL